MKHKILLALSLTSLLLVGCNNTKTSSNNSSSNDIEDKDGFIYAHDKTFENKVYQYNYTLSASIKYKGAINIIPAEINGVVQYDSSGKNDTIYMEKKDVSSLLNLSYTTYTYNVGTDLVTINANENKDFSVVDKERIPENYDFESNNVGIILKSLDDKDNLSIKKDGDKYILGLKSDFAQESFLSILNYMDSNMILDALSEFTLEKWGEELKCNCWATLTEDETRVNTFHYDVSVNIKDNFDITLAFEQNFEKVGGGVTIEFPTFENTFTNPSDIDEKLTTLKSYLEDAKKCYYTYELNTKVDHGMSKANPLGLAIKSTTKGYAEREIIDDQVYFHNGVGVDSDYVNKDQYPDDVENYKMTRAKLNNKTNDVYDVEVTLLSDVYNLLNDYNNDSVDDYYMMVDSSLLSSDEVKILRNVNDTTKSTYRLGISGETIQGILETYNKSIRLDKDGRTWIDVYDIDNDFKAKNSDVEFVVENNKLKTIDMGFAGFYNINTGKQVKFEFDLSIKFDYNKPAYVAPIDASDIELSLF